jgi:hypothetical protein
MTAIVGMHGYTLWCATSLCKMAFEEDAIDGTIGFAVGE